MKHVIRTTVTPVVLASLAMTAAAQQTHKHRNQRQDQELALGSSSSEIQPMVGTWTLRNGDKPRTDIKMVFRRNGTFAFVGPNWQSAGKFRMQETKLALEWTTVDGSKVAPGTVKKDFPIADDRSSFTIDKYTYYKLER
jgi:hypothetical protein